MMEEVREQEITVTESITFMHPGRGMQTVRLTEEGKFKNTETNEESLSITYYGNFGSNVGYRLNARISRPADRDKGNFQIRTPEQYAHLGFSDILEIIHPTGGLQLVAKVPNSTDFVVILVSDFLLVNSPALSLKVVKTTCDHIKSAENPAIQTAYDELRQVRSDFHLGLIDLEGQMSLLHYNIIKLKFMEIVETSKIYQNVIEGFSVSPVNDAERKTILLKPLKNKAYKYINVEMRNWLNMFNAHFDTQYTPNGYSDHRYDPHITVVPSNICNKVVEIRGGAPEKFGELSAEINAIWQALPAQRIGFRHSNYKPYASDDFSQELKDLIQRAKDRLKRRIAVSVTASNQMRK